MPYIAPVIAYVDGSGRLLCEEHKDRARGESIPQYADNSAIHDVPCDCCGKVFDESVSRLKVRFLPKALTKRAVNHV